jgi:hypothetical protein
VSAQRSRRPMQRQRPKRPRTKLPKKPNGVC